jgi:hypothetical protein
MNTLALRHCSFFVALLAAFPVLLAQEAAPPPAKRAAAPSELVISKGTFEWNGQKGPATLRRVVDAITSRYPQANITLVGTDDVLIESVTLRLRRVLPDGSGIISPPLHGMLVALRAASGGRFHVEAFGDNDFVLSANTGHAARAEVFKLGQPSDAAKATDAALRAQIASLETELAVLGRRYGPDHPSMKDISTRRDVLKEQLNRAAPPAAGTEKLIDQIEEVVRMTLKSLRPGEPAPEFRYHAGSGLLVVIGSEEAIDVTRKVVDAIQ